MDAIFLVLVHGPISARLQRGNPSSHLWPLSTCRPMKTVSIYATLVVFLFLQPRITLAVHSTVPLDDIQPGDLLFFWISEKGRHVGVYLEDGVFFHASTSEGVTLSNLDDDYWRYRLISVRRVNHAFTLQELKQSFAKYDHAPYSFGSTGPDRFDCSGLVWRVFGEHGVDVPRTTKTQLRTGKLVISGRNYLLKNRR